VDIPLQALCLNAGMRLKLLIYKQNIECPEPWRDYASVVAGRQGTPLPEGNRLFFWDKALSPGPDNKGAIAGIARPRSEVPQAPCQQHQIILVRSGADSSWGAAGSKAAESEPQ